MEGPTISFLLKGNIKNSGKLALRIPHSNIKHGLWQISLRSVGYKSIEALNKIISIETNFVSDIRYSNTNEIESYNAILSIVNIKGIVNEVRSFHISETWFVINCPSEILEVTFRDTLSNSIVTNLDLIMHVFFLIKQIK